MDISKNTAVAFALSKLPEHRLKAVFEALRDGLKLTDFMEEGRGASDRSQIKQPFIYAKDVAEAEAQLCSLLKRGIQIVHFEDSGYPSLLRQIHNPPLLLFYRGTLEAVNAVPAVSIVGTRRPDMSACEIAERFSEELSERGNVIVSGLAVGIDAKAHVGALASQASFPTVAVLGCGLYNFYPRINKRLGDRIIDNGGAIISQFHPEMKPLPYNFLNRNRLIAGLSLGTLVVQAAERSGSLVTARFALEEGREVMAVPGSILSDKYRGCLRLIKEGATLVTCVEDILEALPELNQVKETASQTDFVPINLSKDAQIILGKLSVEHRVKREELSKVTLFEMHLDSVLLELEMANQIYILPGDFYQRRLKNS